MTTLLWGVGACMQLLVLSWAQRMLALSLSQAAYLQASTAIGVVIGAILAARHVSLKNAPSVLVPGLVMGATLPLMLWIHQWQWALLLTLGLGVAALGVGRGLGSTTLTLLSATTGPLEPALTGVSALKSLDLDLVLLLCATGSLPCRRTACSCSPRMKSTFTASASPPTQATPPN